jgi:stage II sporulation protein M
VRARGQLARLLLLSAIFYLGGVVWGYAASGAGSGEVSQGLLRGMAEFLAPIAGMSRWQMMAFIFLNNAVKGLAMLLLGLAFGVVPFIFLVINGLITGLVVRWVEGLGGMGLAMAALLPHGVIEIPALLLAAALGFRIGGEAFRRLTRRPAQVGQQLRAGLKLFLVVVAPALLVAAAVETFVTPLLIRS